MASRISSIVPLLFITLFCVGLVEGGYQAFEKFILKVPVQEEAVENGLPGTSLVEKRSTTGQAKKPDYSVIVKRNLFGLPPEKAKPEPVVVSEETTTLKASELGIVLMGTVSGSSDSKRAIILTKKNRDQELYSEGEVIEGALIKEIQRGKIILSLKGRDEMLDMSEAAKMRPVYKPPRQTQRIVRPTVTTQTNAGNGALTRPRTTTSTPPRRRVVRRQRVVSPETGNIPGEGDFLLENVELQEDPEAVVDPDSLEDSEIQEESDLPDERATEQ